MLILVTASKLVLVSTDTAAITVLLLFILVAIVADKVATVALVATSSPFLNNLVALALTAKKLVAFNSAIDALVNVKLAAYKSDILATATFNILVLTVVALIVGEVIFVVAVPLLKVISVALTAFMLVVPFTIKSLPIVVLFSIVKEEPSNTPPIKELADTVVATLTLITLPYPSILNLPKGP